MNSPLIAQLDAQLGRLKQQGLRRQRKTTSSPCAPEMMVDGEWRLAFNSNDYLGLASDARIVSALHEGALRYGAGSGASHLVSGHSLAHQQLEEQLARLQASHIECVRALSFCTGFMANLAAIGALVDVQRGESVIFSESLNHASLIDGMRLSRAPVEVYPHRDVQALSDLMQKSSARHKIVVSDGVFSMDGDLAPVPELLALCERHGAWLVIDDAHGFGVLGANGHGILEHFGVRSPHLVYVGTLGKAAGVAGAYVVAHERLIEWMVQRARPYIYTTAAAPALAHALLTSIDIITSDEGQQRREHLRHLIEHFKCSPISGPWQRLHSDTAIQPIVIGSNAQVLSAAVQLQAQGLWLTAIRAPTVPVGTARLRITLNAAHSLAQVDRLLVALQDLTV